MKPVDRQLYKVSFRDVGPAVRVRAFATVKLRNQFILELHALGGIPLELWEELQTARILRGSLSAFANPARSVKGLIARLQSMATGPG